jgi:UDP-N-acetylmuramate: L-alanyl-gamma-D-glutamyl-meso-diaminopimelate ligase
MGSLAGLLVEAGYEVRGSDDAVYPPMSTMLRERGITILEGYRSEHLDDRPDLVVVGNVASAKNPEAVAVQERKIPYLSMPQAIGQLFLEGRHPIVITGTHGKTTTAALMAWVLTVAGRKPSFLIGGVLRNFNCSYALGGGEEFVIEGDEYETSFFDKGSKFLHYLPRTAVVTSVEFDHAEMFGSLDAVKAAFRQFVPLVPRDGLLVVCGDDPNALEVTADAATERIVYGLSPECRWRGRVLSAGPGGMQIEILRDGTLFGSFETSMFGVHNLRNILAVSAVASSLGVDAPVVGDALKRFEGVRRRQELRGVAGGVTVIDDFAHHPTAVRLTLDGLRQRYASQKLWAIFEPRTNTSRRSVFQQEYARSFDAADRVVIAAVDHPERAPEGERFEPERLVAELRRRGKDAHYLPEVAAIVNYVAHQARPEDVVVVMSNGAFGGIHGKLLEALSHGV